MTDVRNAWLAGVEKFVRETRDPSIRLSFEPGKKYIRVVEERPGQRSVFCFLEASTGAILKAAGWKAPAKGIRGYITDPNYSIGRGITQYGGSYRR